MAEKKEGKDIPNTPKIVASLSNQLFFQIAANNPTTMPIKSAMKMELTAKIMVLGKVSIMILLTFLSVFLKDVLK